MLRWPDLHRVPESARALLLGPGAPFELAREDVRGVEMTVFANRPRNVVEVLRAAGRDHADRPYLILGDRTVTYAEATAVAERVAAVLHGRHGVRRGDRVALVGANSVEHALTIWAVVLLGGVVVGLNGWWTGPEMRHGLVLTGPRLLVGDERRLERIERLAGMADAGLPVVTFDELAAEATVSVPDALDRSQSSVRDVDVDENLFACDIGEDEPIAVLFTSGTTGRAKGAVLSHRAVVNFGLDASLRGAVEVVSGDAAPPAGAAVSVLASPLFHISGLGPLLGAAPRSGMTLVLAPPGRWDPAAHLELTRRYGVTQWTGVPTQFLRLLEHPDLDPATLVTLRGIGCGGAPMPPELPRVVAERLPGVRVSSGYGMTETFGVGTAIGGTRLVTHPGAVGVPTPTSELMLRDADGSELTADGDVGEIWLRNPSVFLGYWNDEEATAAVLDADGWYRSGDYGRIVDGMVYLESRLRDLIIRGGENIYPIEIENRLIEHPGIAEAAVIGVPHHQLGQEVLAVLVPHDGSILDPAEVRDWVAATLAAFKVPARIRIVDALPHNASGKVIKRDLEDRFAEDADLPHP
ncbi:AMP-dependent synthetase [Frankia sp. CcI49]|nr:AMP-dependent synthetase [Frankia sp. CcI49]